MSFAPAASTDSMQSTLKLPEQGSSSTDPNIMKFSISVSFLDFKDLTAFCRLVFRDEPSQSPPRSFWLSWVLFDNIFQSEKFSADESDPQKIRDIIRVRCSQEAMMNSLTNTACMRLCLCTQGSVIAALGMPLYRRATSPNQSPLVQFPLSSIGWYDLEYSQSLFSSPSLHVSKPSVKVDITVNIEEESGAVSQWTPTTSRIPRRSPPSSPPVIATPTIPPTVVISDLNEMPSKEVRFSIDVPEESDIKSSKKKEKGSRIRPSKRHQDLCETSSEDAGDSLDEEDMDNLDSVDEDDEDDYTRHYRVNVEVKSIGGLKRAANASIHFTYPFLGAGGPVRTHPLWLPANTEGKIDGGVVSYDCCMSRNRIKDIMSQHPLKISALSRSHLGSANIGDVTVDLFGVLESKPHSYRCSMTNKTFKTREEYTSHRQSLLAMRSLGQVDRTPHKDPITIWANDSYLPLTMNNKQDRSSDNICLGGRLRVVIIIEEISVVGAEVATSVRPGYKMHNGALYTINDPQSENKNQIGNENIDPESVPTPLDRVGLTESERVALERLRSDWEAYRVASEVQWRNSLRDRELQMRTKLEAETSAALSDRADDLKRAQEEAGRLEVRLRGAIDEAERQKTQLKIKEEQMQMKLAQKTAELQLLQRRVRDEAKARIDSEVQKSDGLLSQINSQKQQIERYEKRVQDIEREFESFRNYSRGTPESILREEISRVRGQLGESKAEVERERRIKSEAELEKEHYRAQMHRLAIALKRERERSTASARQDLDQLRLEFLAREERCVKKSIILFSFSFSCCICCIQFIYFIFYINSSYQYLLEST